MEGVIGKVGATMKKFFNENIGLIIFYIFIALVLIGWCFYVSAHDEEISKERLYYEKECK